MNFTEQDLQQIARKEMSVEQVLRQMEIFRRGVRYSQLERPAVMGDGIISLTAEQFPELIGLYEEGAALGRFIKFVPASGAATRMFKVLTVLLHLEEEFGFEELREKCQVEPSLSAGLEFFLKLKKFAFYPELQRKMQADGGEIEELYEGQGLRIILEYLLTEKGLNYGSLPKGLIEFHHYAEETRTAFRENIAEAVKETRDNAGIVRMHFTTPERWREAVEAHCSEYCRRIAEKMAVKEFRVTFSVQKSSTETIAVDLNGEPLREVTGELVFRPGGHGALLENLQELEGDIVYINNIDNLRPEWLKADTYLYRKLLGGLLIKLQKQVFEYLGKLEAGENGEDLLREVEIFVREDLNVVLEEDYASLSREKKIAELIHRLYRPLRVCGMVKNIGAPGGGPFWVKDKKGRISLQIVETSQIDIGDAEQKRILQASTHFNPVDVVCGMRDHRQRNFDLKRFVDEEAVFIAHKSKDGKEILALELPGLWNGAMAYWNTVFVETPLSTFSPVKTINDLLQKVHQD